MRSLTPVRGSRGLFVEMQDATRRPGTSAEARASLREGVASLVVTGRI